MFQFCTVTTALSDRLQAFVGRQAAPPLRARDAVNQPMIRHWCDAIGDENPVYTDPEAAAASRHGGIVAPPAMLQAWTMPGLAPRRPTVGGQGRESLFGLLDAAGFTSVVATNCEQTYARYLRPGDFLTVSQVIESISDEKRTALGLGHFATWLDTYRDEAGEVVGTMRFRVLKFRPAVPAPPEPAPAQPAPHRPAPAINDDNRFFWEGVERGELLIQRCAGCGALRHPPRPMCPRCRSLEWDTVAASGRGSVHSYVVPEHPRLPAFPEPYVVALIDLDEGTRLVSNLVDVAPADVRVGMPVQVTFRRPDGELTLPLFAPVGARLASPAAPGGVASAAVSTVDRAWRPGGRRKRRPYVEEELPELLVELTPTLIIAGAIASRDYQDVHHDVELARQRGMPGIFMNILTTNGFVGRFVTDWAGPNATIRSIAIRLGAPNFAGDAMRLVGRVISTEGDDVEVEVVGRNRIGDHVTGRVALTLP
jgi:uncharacterized OB-fold protein/acyl dehydratase